MCYINRFTISEGRDLYSRHIAISHSEQQTFSLQRSKVKTAMKMIGPQFSKIADNSMGVSGGLSSPLDTQFEPK
jgi:membrane protease subunit (stomatin/prohibitin family)